MRASETAEVKPKSRSTGARKREDFEAEAEPKQTL